MTSAMVAVGGLKMKKIVFRIIVFLFCLFPILSVNAVSCGNITDIPEKIPQLTSDVVKIIEIIVPVVLVIMGGIDLVKGITSQKEDEIKKGQKIFIKRLVLGAIVFFVVVLVKLLVSIVAESTSGNISSCIDCFFSDNCKK